MHEVVRSPVEEGAEVLTKGAALDIHSAHKSNVTS